MHKAIRIRVLVRENDNKVKIKIKFTTAMGDRARVKPWLNSSSQVSKELFTLNMPQQALWFDHVSNIPFSFKEGSPSHTHYNKICFFCIKSKLHLEINQGLFCQKDNTTQYLLFYHKLFHSNFSVIQAMAHIDPRENKYFFHDHGKTELMCRRSRDLES